MRLKHLFFVVSLLVAICSNSVQAASKEEIDADVQDVLKDFYYLSAGNKELAGKAAGILVFPSVVKAGFMVGAKWRDNGTTI